MTGFGAVGFDADNDGRVDLFLAKRPCRRTAPGRDVPCPAPPALREPGRGAVRGRVGRVGPVISPRPWWGAARPPETSTATAASTWWVVHRDARAAVLLNRTDAGHWLALRLRGTTSGRNPVGARVTCRAGGREMTRWLTTGASYLASGDPKVWLGLGTAEAVERLEVRWPSGLVQSWSNPRRRPRPRRQEGRDPTPR